MDPFFKLLITSLHEGRMHDEALREINLFWQGIPFYQRNDIKNQFLLERANCYWFLEEFQKCFNDLQEVHSNGLLILFSYPGERHQIYLRWLSRGNQILDAQPSLAKFLFSCCNCYAPSTIDKARCLVFKGVATWLTGDHQKGMELMEEGSEINSDIIEETISIWKECGVKALGNKDFTKSKNVFERILILVQGNMSNFKETRSCILGHLATVYFHLNEYQTALEKGEEAYAENPISSHEEAEKWKERTETIFREGNFILLIKYCTLAMRFTPNEANHINLRSSLLSSRCTAYTKTNEYTKALEDAEECARINHANVNTSQEMYLKFTIQGNEFLNSDYFILAKLFFDCTFPHATKPIDTARSLVNKGVATWLAGDQSEGMKLIEKGSEINPEIIEQIVSVWKKYGIKALGEKDFQKSEKIFQTSFILLPSHEKYKNLKSGTLSDQATVYFHMAEYQTALEKGEEAYVLNPISSHEEAERWKERAETIFREGKFVLLIKYCTLAIRFTPDGTEYTNLRSTLLSSRCTAYTKTNEYDKALEDAEECARINPTWSKGHYQLGATLFSLGRYHEAVLSFCKAFKVAEDSDLSDIMLQILSVAKQIPDGITNVTLDVPRDIIEDLIKQCVANQDWEKLRLLFVGGGGPDKYDPGKGGLATGCNASCVPLEQVVQWGTDNNADNLAEFLEELIKHGAINMGSPLQIADKPPRELLRVISKYKKSKGETWHENGIEAFDSGDFTNAILLFQNAIQCDLDFQERLDVYSLLSKAYYQTEDYQNCIDICNQVHFASLQSKQEDPSSNRQILFNLLCLRSSSHLKLKDFQQALDAAIEATKLEPDDIEGYTLLVSCYKTLERNSEIMWALNECMRIECNSDEQWEILKKAMNVAMTLKERTSTFTTKISTKLLKRLQKEAIRSNDWDLIRLLYLGGGGPDQHQVGKGGIATGCLSASSVAIEDVISAKFKRKLETLSALLDNGASVNGLRENPLVCAVAKMQVDVVKVLLEHGANPCVKTDNDQPLVHSVVQDAIDRGSLNMLHCFLDYSQHHFIEKAKDSRGDTLYHLAMNGKIHNNKCKVIRLLLNAKVNPTLPNNQGKQPLDCCRKNDDRSKMIKKFIKEQSPMQYVDHSHPKKVPYVSNTTTVVQQVSPQGSSEQETSKLEITVKSIKSETTKSKKKDMRKHLEQLIENLNIMQRNKDKHIEDDVDKQETEKLIESDHEELVNEEAIPEAAKNEKTDVITEEIEQTQENQAWEVDFTDKFKKRFKGKRIDQKMKSKIKEKIRMLQEGRWSKTLCKRLEGEPKRKGILLFESKLTGGARMLWEKTIAFSTRCNMYTDVIRVWDVVMDHGNLDQEIQNVVRSIVQSHERGSHCTMKVMLKGIKKEKPGSNDGTHYPSFYQKYNSNPSEEQSSESERVFYPPASAEDNEYNILKIYSFNSSVIDALLDSDRKAEINFPFKVTESEHKIINLKPNPTCPIILLGRSGTGKTTCCLYRLWTEFQNYWENAAIDDPRFSTLCNTAKTGSEEEGTSRNWEGLPSVLKGQSKSMERNLTELHEHFHPLFITKSNVLCNEVRRNFKEIINANPSIKSKIVSEDSFPNRIQDIGDRSWPLIVSSRDWLLLLDASLPGSSFFQRAPDGSLLNKIDGWGNERKQLRLISLEDEDDNDLDKLQEDGNVVAEDKKFLKTKKLERELTYQVFRNEFWPKMRTEIRKKIHPILVWTEIRSFIKGSFDALNTEKGFLSMDEYQELGRKRAPNFMEDRSTIYGLFKFYQRFLTSMEMFDEADLVYQLHRRLSTYHLQLPWSIHSVYVDETQDFTQAELSLLIKCCRFRNRMFFTGDTAQSIVRGIAFRFEDVKTLFHAWRPYDETINVPDCLYQLTHNYRSHAGILRLASSVVKLLYRFFPQSFDKLAEDSALFEGPKPVLLESCSLSDLSSILKGNKRETSRIEFGAHQAVLVASEEVRDNMPDELKQGLVLTIYEAKGLEFDDVLIYNFFKGSHADKEWRIVTSYALEEQGRQTQSEARTGHVKIHEENLSSRPLEFDYDKHKILNSEFKTLYTAITRARVNLWFFDEDEEARRPVFEYFQRLGLVRINVLKNEEETAAASTTSFAESSTKAQWKEQGIHYYNQHRWALAEKCFTNAGDELMASQSKARCMFEEAATMQDSPRLMNEKFCIAAAEFLKCGMAEEAADCLRKAGENLLLAKLYERMGRPQESVYEK